MCVSVSVPHLCIRYVFVCTYMMDVYDLCVFERACGRKTGVLLMFLQFVKEFSRTLTPPHTCEVAAHNSPSQGLSLSLSLSLLITLRQWLSRVRRKQWGNVLKI